MTSPVPKTMAAPTRVSGSNPRRDRTHSTLRPSRPLWLHGLLGFPVLWERLGRSPPSLPHHLTDLKVCVLRPRPHGRPPRRRLGPGPAPASSAPVSSPRPPARRAGSSSSLGSGRPSPLSSEVPHGPFTPERPRARALAAFPSRASSLPSRSSPGFKAGPTSRQRRRHGRRRDLAERPGSCSQPPPRGPRVSTVLPSNSRLRQPNARSTSPHGRLIPQIRHVRTELLTSL